MATDPAPPAEEMSRKFRESLLCSICMDILRTPIYTVNTCNHVFCETCLRETRYHGGDTCPNCREPIEEINRSVFIENIVELYYEMNKDVPRRPPCEPWTRPERRPPSVNDAFQMYQYVLGNLIVRTPPREIRRWSLSDGYHAGPVRRSRRIQGLPPRASEENPLPRDETPEEEDAVTEEPSPPTPRPLSQDDLQVAPVPYAEPSVAPPAQARPRRGRKRPRPEPRGEEAAEEATPPQTFRATQPGPSRASMPSTSRASQPSEDRTCTMVRPCPACNSLQM